MPLNCMPILPNEVKPAKKHSADCTVLHKRVIGLIVVGFLHCESQFTVSLGQHTMQNLQK